MGNMHTADLSEIKGLVDDLETRLTSTRAGLLDNLDCLDMDVSGYRDSLFEKLAGCFDIPQGTLTEFQATPATGTMNTPEAVNDNNTGVESYADSLAEYVDIDLGKICYLRQYRQYGSTTNNGDGIWWLQYKKAGFWRDWITDIATWTAAGWSGWVYGDLIAAQYLRLKCYSVDTGDNKSHIAELEVICYD